mgnify:CR=1 FL=1
MRRYIVLLLITGIVWAQTDFDKLTIEEKAIYNAKKDANKWLAYPLLALIPPGGLGTATYFAVREVMDTDQESSLILATIVGSLGLVGSYNLFSIEDKKNIEGKSADDIELYQQAYSKEFKDRKLKNIVIGSSLLGLTAGAGIHYFLSNFSFGSDYDVYMGP